MNINKRFTEKRVLITGAGSGLGRALALEFAKMKWNIAVADINKKGARETVAMVNKLGGAGLDIFCDVTKPAHFTKVATRLLSEWDGVDILVNNAGIAAVGYFEKIPLDKWDWIIAVNQKSIVYGCRSFIPIFKQQKSGYIVNVASNAGIASLPEMGSYNVTKAAAISTSETLRLELSSFNIGVSVICPTFFKTNLLEGAYSTDAIQRIRAEKFFEKSKSSAEKVAEDIISAIEKNRFYVLSQSDGKAMWRLKRYFPELYFKVSSYIYNKGYIDKYLGM